MATPKDVLLVMRDDEPRYVQGSPGTCPYAAPCDRVQAVPDRASPDPGRAAARLRNRRAANQRATTEYARPVHTALRRPRSPSRDPIQSAAGGPGRAADPATTREGSSFMHPTP